MSSTSFCYIIRISLSLVGFPHSSVGKESACNAGDLDSIPGSGRSPEKEMAIHSSIIAWKIPWTKEPGGLLSMGSQELDTTERLNHHHHHWYRVKKRIFLSYLVMAILKNIFIQSCFYSRLNIPLFSCSGNVLTLRQLAIDISYSPFPQPLGIWVVVG